MQAPPLPPQRPQRSQLQQSQLQQSQLQRSQLQQSQLQRSQLQRSQLQQPYVPMQTQAQKQVHEKLITREMLQNYLTNMAKKIHSVSSYDQSKDSNIVAKINDLCSNMKFSVTNKDGTLTILNEPLTIERLLGELYDLSVAIKNRIGEISDNMVTKSSERIKIYTSLYTIIYVYAFLNGSKNNIELSNIVDGVLSSRSTINRTLSSGLFTVNPFFSDDVNREKKLTTGENAVNFIPLEEITRRENEKKTIREKNRNLNHTYDTFTPVLMGGKSKKNKKRKNKTKKYFYTRPVNRM